MNLHQAFLAMMRRPASIRFHPLDQADVDKMERPRVLPMVADRRVIPGFLEVWDARGRLVQFQAIIQG